MVTAGQKLVHHQARIDLLQLEQSRLAAEFAAGEEWDRDGFNSAYDWIRVNCHLPGNVAGNYLTVGAHLPQLGQSVEAVLKGEIGYAHLAVMARTAEAVGKRFDESQLLPLAKEHSAGKFHYKCLHYRHSLDAKAYAAEESEQVENRRLHLSTVEDGSLLINGVLDPAGSPAPSDGARRRLAADQNRIRADHHHRPYGYVRAAARTGLIGLRDFRGQQRC